MCVVLNGKRKKKNKKDKQEKFQNTVDEISTQLGECTALLP